MTRKPSAAQNAVVAAASMYGRIGTGRQPAVRVVVVPVGVLVPGSVTAGQSFRALLLGSASIWSSATLAQCAVSSSTWIRLTTRASASDSSAHTRCGRSMRFIVEQKHTVRSRKTTCLSGCASASRLTRFSSVPIAHADPAGAASSVWMMYSVEPDQVGVGHDLVPALRVHEHVHARDPLAHVVAPSRG